MRAITFIWILIFLIVQVGSGNNSSDLYTGDNRFESPSGQRLPRLGISLFFPSHSTNDRILLVATCLLLVLFLPYSSSSTRKMKAVRSAETSENFYQTTRCHTQEDSALHRTSNPADSWTTYSWWKTETRYMYVRVRSTLCNLWKWTTS
jgi:hypothetical protein